MLLAVYDELLKQSPNFIALAALVWLIVNGPRREKEREEAQAKALESFREEMREQREAFKEESDKNREAFVAAIEKIETTFIEKENRQFLQFASEQRKDLQDESSRNRHALMNAFNAVLLQAQANQLTPELMKRAFEQHEREHPKG